MIQDCSLFDHESIGIDVSGCGDPEERKCRLHRVLGFLQGQDVGLQALLKIACLADNKGVLSVVWDETPETICRIIVEVAWAAMREYTGNHYFIGSFTPFATWGFSGTYEEEQAEAAKIWKKRRRR